MEPAAAAAGLQSPTGDSALVTANYNKLSDHIRRLTPHGIQCSVFCGGAHCKYENPDSWTPDSLAIQGLYSHWITDHVLAMARPSTVVIIQKSIIQQFQSLGIKSVINLQCSKEHASCGHPLESSGFSYDPNIFMENNIYYYNFAWKDYGDATLIGLLNMVKVIAFAVTEGRVAIHCHAGLGRTGVLIACYLVYSLKVTGNTAIKYVRLRRPGSVQTRGQIVCVRHFAHYILPNLITFHIKDHSNKEVSVHPFTLNRFLKKQKIALHGYEERSYKHIPKIIHRICERILKICGCWIDDFPPSNIPLTSDFFFAKSAVNVQRHESIYSICSNLDDVGLSSPSSMRSPSTSGLDMISVGSSSVSPNPSETSDAIDSFSELDDHSHEELLFENECFQELEKQKSFHQDKINDDPMELQNALDVVDTLITMDVTTLPLEVRIQLRALQTEINSSQMGWLKLDTLTDVRLLSALLYDWLENLKKPVLDRDNMEAIVINYKRADVCFSKLDSDAGYLLEYILIFISKIQILSQYQFELMRRFLAALTQQYVVLRDVIVPSGREFRKLRDGTLACTTEFLENLFELVDMHHRQKSSARLDFEEQYNDDDGDVETGFHE